MQFRTKFQKQIVFSLQPKIVDVLILTDISSQHCQVSIQRQAQTPAERQPGHVGARLEGAGQLHFRAGSSH